MILYFSSTGNCKYVAERLAAALHDRGLKPHVNPSRQPGRVFLFMQLPMSSVSALCNRFVVIFYLCRAYSEIDEQKNSIDRPCRGNYIGADNGTGGY